MKIPTKIYILFLAVISCTGSGLAQDGNISAEVFGKLPEITYAELSPDGSKILFLQNVNGKKIVVTRSLLETNIQYSLLQYLCNPCTVIWLRSRRH